MNKFIKGACILAGSSLLLAACSKFESINTNPKDANENQLEVEYAINGAIVGAQMNPDIAERAFVIYWKTTGHQHRLTGISGGTYDDGYTSAYYNGVSGWLNTINLAVDLAKKRIADNNTQPYTKNLLEVARIWRAYLMSEMSDNFGPIPVIAFQGTNPEFSDVKTIYYYILAELKDASAKMDENIANPDDLQKFDPAYKYDFKKWKRFANSLRMRLAMRLSEVDPAKARQEFEAAAATNMVITEMNDAFSVQEREGWHDLAGVMSREWNTQLISTTLNNLYIGLGGVPTKEQVPVNMHPYIKPENWIGRKLADHFTSLSNDPAAGYWFDGLPATIDPRAYQAFIIPGDTTNPNFGKYPDAKTIRTYSRNLENSAGKVVKELNGLFTWNATVSGDWGTKGAVNRIYTWAGSIPRLSHRFRTSTEKRIFFAPWETYFLMAEAGVRGWAIPTSAQAAYEAGIRSNFEYWNVTKYLSNYLTSTSYNMAGTSVSWSHTAEPGTTHVMEYKDGYNDNADTATVNIKYPSNTLYKGGSVRNDLLTKIITQKFIAQTPWLPLETWSDQRRLGLPFFENPAIENPLLNLPALNRGNYMTSDIRFFPQRLRYPSALPNSNPAGYQQAVSHLKGTDAVLTPLWWAKH